MARLMVFYDIHRALSQALQELDDIRNRLMELGEHLVEIREKNADSKIARNTWSGRAQPKERSDDA